MDSAAERRAATLALLIRLSRAIDSARREEADRLGLTPAQVDVLRFAAEVRPDVATVGQLARVLGVRHPTAVGMLRPLIGRGLLARAPHPYDGRQHSLELTRAGTEVLAALDAAESALASALAGLPDAAFAALETGLTSVAQALAATGTLVVPAACRGCIYFGEGEGSPAAPHHCHLIKRFLTEHESRMKCPEHTPAAASA